jgi:dTDP-4-amino-4,6-dideoxygalactose transaminase
MEIPLVDLKVNYLSMKEEIDSSLKEIIDKSAFIGGEFVEEFEKNFAEYCGKKYCASVNSGTSALFIVLKCLGIGKGDEIITVPNTFIATTEAIREVGAKPVFVDVNEENALMDINKIEEKINEKTKAIIPVHLYGNVCDMNQIKNLAEKHNLKIIEDCAQAHGAEYNGKKVPIEEIGCFSFFPAKILGAYGDAGGIVTDNEELYNKIKLYSDHGRKTKYEHIAEGFNFRISSLQAKILDIKLNYLEYWISKRRNLAKKYDASFREIKKIRTLHIDEKVKNSYYVYVIRVLDNKRNDLKEFLKENGIETGIHFPIPLNKQPVYSKEYKNKEFPVSEKLAEEVLSIPMFPELTEEQQEYIIGCIKEFYNK